MHFSETAANEGKIIIISALDGNFLRKAFDCIIELIPLAEKVKKLAAICRQCSANASFSFRTAISDQIELIGGDSMYKPLCRECYIEESRKQEQEKKEVYDFSMEGSIETNKSSSSISDKDSLSENEM